MRVATARPLGDRIRGRTPPHPRRTDGRRLHRPAPKRLPQPSAHTEDRRAGSFTLSRSSTASTRRTVAASPDPPAPTGRSPDDTRAVLQRSLDLARGSDQEAFAAFVADFLASAEEAGTVPRRGAVSRMLRRQFQNMNPHQLAQFIAHTERLLQHPLFPPRPLPAVPTVILHGSHDRFTPPAMGADLAAAVPGSLRLTMDNTGHLTLVVRFATDRPLHDLAGVTVHPTATAPHHPVP
ncbi:alpha/beta fold hydrolase [Streptomyces sp. NPDC002992]|uniref:alpha/beta fold hydrolase n=1 Tax=Streptomyces sp. NPDC002992 TaxID=3154273 RepID=UPI0033A80605